ncbi:unnamed protein product [Lymnaea stagnalis]|uniref:Protein-cysteine N-palmitoyltransferase Rasp n=1 Tax=Lymnaea stagnalis TaxID=6523 RepID=A0AAV2GYN5_LYMST
MLVDVLPKWERMVYWIVGVIPIFGSLYCLYLEGQSNKRWLHPSDFQKNWRWLGHDQDQSDNEWSMWKSSLPWLILSNICHLSLSQACFFFSAKKKVRVFILSVFDVAALAMFFGVWPVLLYLSKFLLMYIISCTSCIPAVWLTAVIMTATGINSTLLEWQLRHFFLRNPDTPAHSFIVASGFFDIHLVSFAIDKIKWEQTKYTDSKSMELDPKRNQIPIYPEVSKEYLSPSQETSVTEDNRPCFMDFFFYTFYLPKFVHGPIYLFRAFYLDINAHFNAKEQTMDIRNICTNLLKILFWALLLDFLLHFFYFSSLGSHPSVVKQLSLAAVCAMGYMQGQIFMVKYFCSYGLTGQLSRFDGVTPHPNPRCISWVYSYTDMWKYFDCGLYKFIKTYIFIPFGGSQAGWFNHFRASAVAFFFIFYWHGARINLFIWAAGNFLTGVVEKIAKCLEQSTPGVRLKSKLSAAMQLRLRVIFIVPLYVISCWLIFCFFFDITTTWVIIEKMILKASWTKILIENLIFISVVHNAVYISMLRRKRRAKSQ